VVPRRREITPVKAASIVFALLALGFPAAAADPEPSLTAILENLSKIATLYQDNALRFTCTETFIDTHYKSLDRISHRRSFRFNYFYAYNDRNLVEASNGALLPGLQDYRTERKDKSPESPNRVDPSRIGLSAHMQRAYSWIFMFQPGMRRKLMFNKEADGRALGRNAWVISFEPLLPFHAGPGDWFGRAWVEKETGQLLLVEAARSGDYLEAARGSVAKLEEHLYVWVRVEFSVEKHGLRFPGEATLVGTDILLPAQGDEGYRSVVWRLLDNGVTIGRVFRVQQKYKDYKFFNVKTDEKFSR